MPCCPCGNNQFRIDFLRNSRRQTAGKDHVNTGRRRRKRALTGFDKAREFVCGNESTWLENFRHFATVIQDRDIDARGGLDLYGLCANPLRVETVDQLIATRAAREAYPDR